MARQERLLTQNKDCAIKRHQNQIRRHQTEKFTERRIHGEFPFYGPRSHCYCYEIHSARPMCRSSLEGYKAMFPKDPELVVIDTTLCHETEKKMFAQVLLLSSRWNRKKRKKFVLVLSVKSCSTFYRHFAKFFRSESLALDLNS